MNLKCEKNILGKTGMNHIYRHTWSSWKGSHINSQKIDLRDNWAEIVHGKKATMADVWGIKSNIRIKQTSQTHRNRCLIISWCYEGKKQELVFLHKDAIDVETWWRGRGPKREWPQRPIYCWWELCVHSLQQPFSIYTDSFY